MWRVLIASPVRQKPAILREFLWSLAHLEETGLKVEYVFIDDAEEKTQVLWDFAAEKRGKVTIWPAKPTTAYHCDEVTHHWRPELIARVAEHKNRFLAKAREEGFDFLFLVDSDLVLHPRTLVHLVGLEKDIVAEVFWTKWEPDLPPLPQVWLAGQYRLYHKEPGEELTAEEIKSRTEAFLEMLRYPGLYKVGGLGGCTLIGRRALAAGVSFAPLPNLDLLGEDRHFCVRAAALGFELFADTLYPPYHIYRESDLEGVAAFKERCLAEKARPLPPTSGQKPRDDVRITLAMLVRNEAHRYLERVLRHAALYIDQAVILDDASEDETVAVCRQALAGIPLRIVSNPEPSFYEEHKLRRQLWELAVEDNPEWILILDADELFEDRAVRELRLLAADPEVEVYNFRLYDFWDEEHYREDEYWQAHRVYRPFLVRYRSDFRYEWRKAPQHSGRFPLNIGLLKNANSRLRVKHLGWMRPADRLAKYYRYKKLDPEARYGIRGQYLSILDPRPNLVRWVEDEDAPAGSPG